MPIGYDKQEAGSSQLCRWPYMVLQFNRNISSYSSRSSKNDKEDMGDYIGR